MSQRQRLSNLNQSAVDPFNNNFSPYDLPILAARQLPQFPFAFEMADVVLKFREPPREGLKLTLELLVLLPPFRLKVS